MRLNGKKWAAVAAVGIVGALGSYVGVAEAGTSSATGLPPGKLSIAAPGTNAPGSNASQSGSSASSPVPGPPPTSAAIPSFPDENQVLTPTQVGADEPFPSNSLDLTSAYLTADTTNYISVYAGSSPSVSNEGEVIVVVSNPTGGATDLPAGVFTTPDSGALTITGVSGQSVSLDGSGASYTFNLSTDSFAAASTP